MGPRAPLPVSRAARLRSLRPGGHLLPRPHAAPLLLSAEARLRMRVDRAGSQGAGPRPRGPLALRSAAPARGGGHLGGGRAARRFLPGGRHDVPHPPPRHRDGPGEHLRCAESVCLPGHRRRPGNAFGRAHAAVPRGADVPRPQPPDVPPGPLLRHGRCPDDLRLWGAGQRFLAAGHPAPGHRRSGRLSGFLVGLWHPARAALGPPGGAGAARKARL